MLLRAKVEDTNDPLNIGRIKVRVYGFHDEIPVEDLPWAEPCFPLGGDKDYGIFTVPDIGSTVWVSFEMDDKLQPDPNCPVWLGTWYGANEQPQESKKEKRIVIKSKNKHKIIISDENGKEGILIQDRNGNLIDIKTDSNELKINILGNANIDVQGTTNLTAMGGVNIDGGSGNLTGVVTQACTCPFTGNPHSDYSQNVKASK